MTPLESFLHRVAGARTNGAATVPIGELEAAAAVVEAARKVADSGWIPALYSEAGRQVGEQTMDELRKRLEAR